jgi:hypothetical protein
MGRPRACEFNATIDGQSREALVNVTQTDYLSIIVTSTPKAALGAEWRPYHLHRPHGLHRHERHF